MSGTDWTPRPKIAAAGTAGALAVIALWIAHRFAGLEVPEDVAGAVVALLAVGTGYLKKDATSHPRSLDRLS